MRIRIIPYLSSIFLAVLLSCSSDKKPNVLFIAVDDLNDWIGCLDNYPGVHTPNLDRLAGSGMLFTNAHCAAPGCNASRTSLITGISPSTSGVYENKDDWREMDSLEDVITLPDHFKNNGYLTMGGGKIYHAHSLREEAFLGHFDPDPWDEWFPSKELQMPYEISPDHWPVNGDTLFYDGYFDWAPMEIEDREMADAKIVSWAEEQLGKSHEKPLFLAVGIYRPHVPWYVPRPWYDLHPLEDIVLPDTGKNDLGDIPPAGQEFARQHWQEWILENEKWPGAVQGYLASMSFADAMVGRLLDALAEGPMAKNTIVILWSDHGYHLGHKQHWEKFALWDQASHVPLIIKDRRNTRPGTTCNQPASLLDIYPTLAELCGLEIPDHVEGESLLPYIKDPGLNLDKKVIITQKPGNHAVQSERWRYIRYANGSEELYDHYEDPMEFTNLAGLKKYDSIRDSLGKNTPGIPKNIPIIDTHIHLYDISLRGEGSWPYKSDTAIYRSFLPEHYDRVCELNNVTATVIVEASADPEENQWVLDQVAHNPERYLAVVGNLPVGTGEFAGLLERFSKDERFVGIRLKRKPGREKTFTDETWRDLQLLQQKGMVLDVLMGSLKLRDVEEIASRNPELKIIINHLTGVKLEGGSVDSEWIASVRSIAGYPNVYCKVSDIFKRTNEKPAPKDASYYIPLLDVIYEAFGEDRLVYASNWPVTKHNSSYNEQLNLIYDCFSNRGEDVLEKLFWKNATEFYGVELKQ